MSIIIKYGPHNTVCTSSQVNYPNVCADISSWPTVDNQVRGYYTFKNRKWSPVNKPYSFKKLALIVESPHKDEFDDIFNPIAPLNGRNTKKKFAKKICSHLKKWFKRVEEKPDVEVYIMNPIQYQTSLWHFLKNKISYNKSKKGITYNSIDHLLRDEVWLFLFNNCNLKNDFENKIRNYGPDYVVNCCTGNCYKKGPFYTLRVRRIKSKKIKTCTKHSIHNALALINYTEDQHPSIW